MECICGLILLLYFAFAEGTGSYFELGSTSTWFDAFNRPECDIATPSLLPGKLPKELSKSVWVGYYRQKVIFEYKGHTKIKGQEYDIGNKTTDVVGLCYSLCRPLGFHTVGVTSDKCFCNEPIEISENKSRKSEQMEVYKAFLQAYPLNSKDKSITSCTGRHRNCLTFDRHKNSSYTAWTNCNCSSVQTICLGDNYDVRVCNHGTYTTWNESVRNCLDHCGSLIYIGDIARINTSKDINATWSGAIRGHVFFRHDDNFNEYYTNKRRYVYLEKTSSGVMFQYSKDGNVLMSVLCKTGSNNIVEVVVFVIGFLVLVAVLFLLYLQKRHRKKLANSCKRSSNAKAKDDTQTFNSIPKYQKPSGGIHHHEYNLEFAKSEDIKDNGTDNPAYDYLDIEPSNIVVYDNEALEIYETNDNVYHEVKLKFDSVYNYTGQNKPVVNTVNHYDTSATAVEKLKAVNGFDELTHDTYNHIKTKQQIGTHTDNTYGVACSSRHEHSADKDGKGESDGYGHLNCKLEKKVIPDSFYNTLSETK